MQWIDQPSRRQHKTRAQHQLRDDHSHETFMSYGRKNKERESKSQMRSIQQLDIHTNQSPNYTRINVLGPLNNCTQRGARKSQKARAPHQNRRAEKSEAITMSVAQKRNVTSIPSTSITHSSPRDTRSNRQTKRSAAGLTVSVVACWRRDESIVYR